MLRLSEYTVPLSSSEDYKRVILIVYAFAMAVLLNSALSMHFACLTCLLMLVYVFNLLKTKKPYPLDECIIYRRGCWFIQQRGKITKQYEHMTIRFDTTFYIFVVFFSETEGKVVRIVFVDQMTPEDYHMLRVLEKISLKIDPI